MQIGLIFAGIFDNDDTTLDFSDDISIRYVSRFISLAINLIISGVLLVGVNPQFQTLIIGLKLPLSELKKRIYQRLEKRFQQGMIQEIEALHRQGLSWQRLEDFGLEYRWISYYLQKKITMKEMKEKLQKEIEKFAKRQLTWFKKDPTIHWIQKEEEAQELIQNFLKKKGFLKEKKLLQKFLKFFLAIDGLIRPRVFFIN